MKFYYPQLDGLRAFAFLLVFIHHLPEVTDYVGYSFLSNLVTRAQSFGWVGVDIFLCLSAYLITKLLLIEFNTTQNISIKYFLIRRSLRIWPLYYLSLLLGFVVLPYFNAYAPDISSDEYQQLTSDHLYHYLFFLGNWSAGLHGFANGEMLAHLWTISLEEQFYVIWPFLLKLLLKKRSTNAVIITIFGLYGIVVLARILAHSNEAPHPFIWTSTITRLDPLLIGTLIAFMPEDKIKAFVSYIKSTTVLLLAIASFCVVALLPNINSSSLFLHLQYPLTAIGAGLFLIAALNDRLFSQATSLPSAVYIGKISYGCYVYHLLTIALSTSLINYLLKALNFPATGLLPWLLIFILAFVLTLLISSLSYSLFEKKWLLLKHKFTKIESRPA